MKCPRKCFKICHIKTNFILYFSLMNALTYDYLDQGIYQGKTSKGFEQLFASLGLQIPLKLKGNLMASKAKAQEAQVQWSKAITKS